MSLTLSHTPGEWEGTWANALRALAADFLSDGPIPVRIVTTDHGPAVNGDLVLLDEDRAEGEAGCDGPWLIVARYGTHPAEFWRGSTSDVESIEIDPEG